MQISISNAIGGGGGAKGGGTAPFENTKSVRFDGIDDFVDCGDADNLSFGDGSTDSPFSISAWVNMVSSSGFRILNKISSTEIEYLLSFNSGATANKLTFKLFDKLSNKYIGRTSVDTYESLQNTWAHIVATYDGSSSSTGIKLYINNLEIAVINDNLGSYTAMHNTTGSVNIARQVTGFANGAMDEVAIFSSELSQSDITSIYNSGVPNDLTSLSPISWWRMGDGDTFPTLTDNGSGGNNGTMTNMTSGNIVTDVPT